MLIVGIMGNSSGSRAPAIPKARRVRSVRRCDAVTITGVSALGDRRDSQGAALTAEELQAWASDSRQGAVRRPRTQADRVPPVASRDGGWQVLGRELGTDEQGASPMNPEAGVKGPTCSRGLPRPASRSGTGSSGRTPERNRAPQQAVGRSGSGPFGPGRSLARSGTYLGRSALGRE